MTDENWNEHVSFFGTAPSDEKIIWLSKINYFVSMYARSTYIPCSTEVERPTTLRRIMELIHRTSQFQLDLALDLPRRTDEDFLVFFSQEISDLGFKHLISKDLARKLN